MFLVRPKHAQYTLNARCAHDTDMIDRLNASTITSVLAVYMIFYHARRTSELCADVWRRYETHQWRSDQYSYKAQKVQEIYKNDHIIDIHVYTKVLTTGLGIPSGTKRPPEVASTQWCKLFSKVPGLSFNTPDARFVYIRLISDAQIKKVKSQTSTKLKSMEDPKFQNVN